MLNKYNHAVNSIQAPEDLKRKTAQMMRQTLQAPQEAQTKRRRPMVWKATVSFVLVAVLAVGALVIPQNFNQPGGQTKIAPADKQHSFSLVAFAATVDKGGSTQEVKMMKMKEQANTIGWYDEDQGKPNPDKHHISAIMETNFKAVGENIDTVTFSVSQGEFQKRVSIPNPNNYQPYAKAHGLDPNFTTPVAVDAKGNPVSNGSTFIYFGYEAKQTSSYTIRYEDQTDFSKQYGYRVTTIGSNDGGAANQLYLDRAKNLDNTKLTVTVHFKDGTTATKEMKLAEDDISVIALEKNELSPAEKAELGEPPVKTELKLLSGKTVTQEAFSRIGQRSMTEYFEKPTAGETVTSLYLDFGLKIKGSGIDKLTFTTDSSKIDFAGIQVMHDSKFQWLEKGDKSFVKKENEIDPGSKASYPYTGFLNSCYPSTINGKYVEKNKEGTKNDPTYNQIDFGYKALGKSVAIAYNDQDDFAKQFAVKLYGKSTAIFDEGFKRARLSDEPILRNADGESITLNIIYTDGTTDQLTYKLKYVPYQDHIPNHMIFVPQL